MNRNKLKKKVLLVEPSDRDFYKDAKVKEVVPNSASLTLATIAASILKAGHDANVIDLGNFLNPGNALKEKLNEYKPDVIGVTASTPLFNKAIEIAELAKSINSEILAVVGGPHVSGYPKESLEKSRFDIGVVGEGDLTIVDVLNGIDLKKIKGIVYKDDNGKVEINERRPLIENLDELPLPAWHLFDVKKSVVPKFVARNSPVGWLDSSRGCSYGCVYCTKSIFQRTFRTKSLARVIHEVEHLKKFGFKEFHVADDCFTMDMERAEKICDEMIKRKINMPWVALTGIRVDRVNENLLRKMKDAGCYRLFFGIESGNQEILKRIKKNINLEQVRTAVKMANKVGIEAWGSFMIGLPGETEKTMQDTINFAKSLDLDMAKVTITIPLPATELYNEYLSKGLMLSDDWNKFNMYTPARELYNHENLNWDIIERYYKKFYREFYFRPSYLWHRFVSDLKNGMLFEHLKIMLKTAW